MSTHSPLPWRVEFVDGTGEAILYGADGECVTWYDAGPTLDDARFIVRACNVHEELVAALRGILEIGKRDMSNPKYDGYFDSARTALAKAEAK